MGTALAACTEQSRAEHPLLLCSPGCCVRVSNPNEVPTHPGTHCKLQTALAQPSPLPPASLPGLPTLQPLLGSQPAPSRAVGEGFGQAVIIPRCGSFSPWAGGSWSKGASYGGVWSETLVLSPRLALKTCRKGRKQQKNKQNTPFLLAGGHRELPPEEGKVAEGNSPGEGEDERRSFVQHIWSRMRPSACCLPAAKR